MAKQLTNEADYVVVGSGSSGSVVAARLAEAGYSVILLEAGKSDERFLLKKPGMVGPMHAVRQVKKIVDWGFTPHRRSTSSNARCRSLAARSSVAPVRSTAWFTCAAIERTSGDGLPCAMGREIGIGPVHTRRRSRAMARGAADPFVRVLGGSNRHVLPLNQNRTCGLRESISRICVSLSISL